MQRRRGEQQAGDDKTKKDFLCVSASLRKMLLRFWGSWNSLYQRTEVTIMNLSLIHISQGIVR